MRLTPQGFAVLGSALALACGGAKNADGGTGPQQTGGSQVAGANGVGGSAGSGGSGQEASTGGTAITGQGGGSGVPSDAAVTPGTKASADFAARYVPAACRQYVCMTFSADVEACRNDFFNPGFFLPAMVQAIDSGRVLYDANKAGPCLDLAANLPCNSAPPALAVQECAAILKGTVPAGGTCLMSFECADGACLHKQCDFPGCCAGTCGRPLSSGTACVSSDECGPDDYCGYGTASASAKTCRPHESEGKPCDSWSFCQSHLTCDAKGSHTCVPRIKDGAACTPDGPECESLASYCDAVTGKCRPRLLAGAACTAPAAGQTRYDVGCPAFTACIGGVCTSLPAVGAACSVPDGGRADSACRLGGCIQGICQSTFNQPCTLDIAQSRDGGARD